MFGGTPHSKIPHALRFIILLLRISLGLSFFYLGFTSLFNSQLGLVLQERSVPGLYNWLGSLSAATSMTWLHPFAQWAFLVIGAFLILGLLTRISSFAAIILLLASYLPGLTMNYSLSNIAPFINDELIIIICLFLLIAAKAGRYIGLDAFFHFSLRKKNRE